MTSAEACTWDRAAIEKWQREKLEALLAALGPNRFYSPKLGDSLPFTTKRELADAQAQHPPYGTNLTYPLNRYSRYSQTSGTTGRPVRWLDTAESWSWMVECWTRVFRSCGVNANDRVFFPFSFGPFIGFWVAFDAAVRMGCLAIPGGGMRSAARLQTILDNEVTVVCSTPTYAVRLAEAAAEEKIDLGGSKVRRIIAAGEPGASIPATRSLIESLWPGARVVDHHGMTETGPVSYECPVRRGVLHIIELGFIPEVIHAGTGAPVGPGERGELVLTNLFRLGSPVLRYRTGDIVQRAVAVRCECGSEELALEGGILGRADDMVVVRGVNLYPSAVEEVVRSCGGVAEFRVETWTERAMREMSIQIEPSPASLDSESLAHRVAAALQNAFGLRIAVGCVAPGVLPRFEAKARRWVQR